MVKTLTQSTVWFRHPFAHDGALPVRSVNLCRSGQHCRILRARKRAALRLAGSSCLIGRTSITIYCPSGEVDKLPPERRQHSPIQVDARAGYHAKRHNSHFSHVQLSR
jgi:hypothetical protein